MYEADISHLQCCKPGIRARSCAPEGLCNAPNVGVDWELLAPQAEHQHARDRLLADALEPRQLRLDRLVVQLPESGMALLLSATSCS
jgi:hypothetical protein